MMAIAVAPLGECAMIGVVTLRVEHPAGGAVLRYALPAQVDEVSAERRSLGPVPHHTGFHGNVARASHHQPTGRDARGAPPPEGGGASAASRSTVQPTGLLGCGQCLGDEGLGTTGAASAPVADAPKPDMEIVVAAHGTDACEVREVSSLQSVAPTCRLSRFVAHRAKWLMCLHFPTDRLGRASRLLSCHRAVGSPPPRGLTVKRAFIPEIPRRRTEGLIMALARMTSAQTDCGLVLCLLLAP